MIDSKSVFSDNEYSIMSEVMANEHITQRELSKKLGVSVSTVNAVMKKMIKEGLVKMTQVSQKQVLYMLTPVGVMEKTKKTVSYLKVHYRAIYQTKEKIKDVFQELEKKHDAIFVLMNDDEMSEMIRIALDEFETNHREVKIIITDKDYNFGVKDYNSPVLVHMIESKAVLQQISEYKALTVINLIEQL